MLGGHVGGHVTVSTRVGREVVEKARELGINISQFLRERLEEEVRRRGSRRLGGGWRASTMS